jgi:hypothetical protein
MWFVKKRKRRPPPDWLIRIWAREKAYRWQLAQRLRARSLAMSAVRLQWSFFLFMMIGCLTYTWIRIEAVQEPHKAPDIKSIALPAVGRKARIVMQDQQERSSFRLYMDSINADPVLKQRFDSLMEARPGYADTIRQLQEIFPDQR